MAAVNHMVRRAVLTENTRAKFYGRPFKWGSSDCAKAAAYHLKQFGWKVPPPGRYATAGGARERLAAMGFETLPDLVASIGMAEMPWSRVLPGDLVSFASDHDLGALGIVLGNGLMLGFHEDAIGMATLRMIDIDRAWSVWRG